MKLLKYPDSHQLKLTHWGRFIGLNGVGLSILAFTGLIFYIASLSHQLMCRRVEANQVNCEAIEENFPTRQISTKTISNVQSVSAEAVSTGDSTIYHILLTGSNAESITALQDNAQQVESYAAEVQSFLSNQNETTLFLKSYPLIEPIAWGVFGIWSLMGILPILAALSMPVSIEVKVAPQIEIFYVNHRYPLRTIRQTIKLEALEQIKAVPMDQGSTRVYRLQLFLVNNEIIDMGFLGKIDQAAEVELALKDLLDFDP